MLMDIVEEVAGGDEANYYESRHEPEFFQKLPNGKYLDYIFDKNESYFNSTDSVSFRLNFISMDDYYWKIVKKATILSKNKEKLSYVLTDVPDDSLDVSTSLNTITNYNLVEY